MLVLMVKNALNFILKNKIRGDFLLLFLYYKHSNNDSSLKVLIFYKGKQKEINLLGIFNF